MHDTNSIVFSSRCAKYFATKELFKIESVLVRLTNNYHVFVTTLIFSGDDLSLEIFLKRPSF